MNADYLIYSSHKTSTQSLKWTLIKSGYQCVNCHTLQYNLTRTMSDYFNKSNPLTHVSFIKYLEDYKKTNGKKLKIISTIRNPIDRLISSFFQTFHSDEIIFKKQQSKNTTIMKNTNKFLLNKYIKHIINDDIKHRKESLSEMSEIFNMNIIKSLVKKENYYYLEHDLFELYVLNFKNIIDNDNNLDYINHCLNTKCANIQKHNLSSDKLYYSKYISIKKLIPQHVNDVIKIRYNDIITLFQ
jgi:hypothetical protein